MSRHPIHYHVMGIGDIPTRRQTELNPMLPPLSDAVPEVMMGVDQCFFCIKFGHRQGHCPEKKKKKDKEEEEGVRDEMQSTKEVPAPIKDKARREGYDEFRVVQVRPGVLKPYSLSALWPPLFPVKPTRPSATTSKAMASSSHANPLISSTTSTSAGSATTISTPSPNIVSSSSVVTSRLAGSSGNSASMDGVRSISNIAGSPSKPEWFKKRKRGLESASIIRAELCRHRSCTAQELEDVMF